MALLHGDADLVPTKIELLRAWVPGHPWAAGVEGGELVQVGAYRFDDPDGEVGIETHLLRTGDGHLLQVPLTYRGAPLEAASDALVTTMEHTVLGQRWVYDGCADDVYLAALLTAMMTGGRQADLEVESGGRRTTVESKVQVRGSGRPGEAVPASKGAGGRDTDSDTVLQLPGGQLVVRRRLDTDVDGTAASYGLTGTWAGESAPVLLAYLLGLGVSATSSR